MSQDRCAPLRALPFDIVGGALGIDISKFKQRKGGPEWAGSCPAHQPTKNSTAFSYNQDGRFACFSVRREGGAARPTCDKGAGVGFRLRHERLNSHVFASVAEAEALLDAWRVDYNRVWSLSGLQDRTPVDWAEYMT